MKHATCLYHASEAPQIFDLAPGEAFPDGWFDAPGKATAAATIPAITAAPAPAPAPRKRRARK